MEGRMSICNMSIEGGARAGYVNPDHKTFEWLEGRPYAPTGAAWDRAVDCWEALRTDPDATYDDTVTFDGSAIEPMVTWGITPGQAIGITEPIPDPDALPSGQKETARKGLEHMDLQPGRTMEGVEIDVAFLGSCTNARMSDLREAASLLDKLNRPVADGVRAMVVPGSQGVKQQAETEGLADVFRAAGFDWRGAGCSMCLGMNEDQLQGRELCASSSNRNFIGRQGSKDGRTVLMSPAMVVAAAVEGEVTDVRTLM
jgi:3-isopropylmalate/(R)-2-methylmalate dehydratase large subunit